MATTSTSANKPSQWLRAFLPLKRDNQTYRNSYVEPTIDKVI